MSATEPSGLMPRQPDRRKDVRRKEDAAVHYAAAALVLAAQTFRHDSSVVTEGDLIAAVDLYEDAEAAAKVP